MVDVTRTQFYDRIIDVATKIYNNTTTVADYGLVQQWRDIMKNNADKFGDDLLDELIYDWIPDVMNKLKDLVTDMLALAGLVLQATDFP